MTTTGTKVLTLTEVEAIIEDGLESENEGSLKISKGLKYIKDNRLYPAGGGFAKYVKDRFDMSHNPRHKANSGVRDFVRT